MPTTMPKTAHELWSRSSRPRARGCGARIPCEAGAALLRVQAKSKGPAQECLSNSLCLQTHAQDRSHWMPASPPASIFPHPPSHCRYAPTEEVGDVITAPRNWHFSNRTEEEAPERDAPDTHRSKAAQE